MSSNFKLGRGGNLYDKTTGQWVGVLDADGDEQVVIPPGSTAVTTMQSAQGVEFSAPLSVATQAITPTLKKWADVKAGMPGDLLLNVISDSTGIGAHGSPTGTDLRAASIGVRIKEKLQAAGYSARADSFFGDLGVGGSVATVDPRIAGFSGWFLATQEGLGGKHWRNTATGGDLPFVPEQTWDSVDIYCYCAGGYGEVTVDVGGAVLKTIATANATAGTYKFTAGPADGLTLAAQTLHLKKSATAGEVRVVGVECYNSTKPSVRVRVLGRVGWRSTEWAANVNGWDAGKQLPLVAGDVNIIDLGINDWLQYAVGATDETTFATNMNFIRSQILTTNANAAFVLLSPPNSSTGSAAQANQDKISAAIAALKKSWGCRLVDVPAVWGNYAAANALGLMADQNHPTGGGYVDIANRLFAVTVPAF